MSFAARIASSRQRSGDGALVGRDAPGSSLWAGAEIAGPSLDGEARDERCAGAGLSEPIWRDAAATIVVAVITTIRLRHCVRTGARPETDRPSALSESLLMRAPRTGPPRTSQRRSPRAPEDHGGDVANLRGPRVPSARVPSPGPITPRVATPPTPPHWAGRLLLAPGVAAYVGPVLPTEPHRHHATQLLIAPDGIALTASDAPARTVHVALIASNHPHTLVSKAATAAVVLIEPTSALGRRLPIVEGVTPLPLDLARVRAQLQRPLDPAWVQDIFEIAAFPPAAVPRKHPGISRAQRAIEDGLVGGAVDAASLAAIAGLSEGRLGHAFREHVGLPVRAYVKWKRLERAARHLGRGHTVTEAAHEAGFADAAHLSRTFRALLGLAPTDLAGHVTWITAARDGSST